MKKNLLFLYILPVFLLSLNTFAQNKWLKNGFRIGELLLKPMGIEDRAGVTLNASNIGLFFENRGKLYPRRIAIGPSGEYPFGSGRHYIYRINPFVGIPGNVIQGRFTTNEEWEAIGGLHNPDKATVAISTDPTTWPSTGWPVKDANGNPIFISDQDSYCAYNDANNTVEVLGIRINQTTYGYGVSFAEDMIYFIFEIINTGNRNLEKLYFSLYIDIDTGNVSGGDPEWNDEYYGYDRDLGLIYGYDDGYTSEWEGNNTGVFGVQIIRTPEINGQEVGITDFHWMYYDDEYDIDTLQYSIMSSNPNLKNSQYGYKYFHLGSSPDIHFDDVNEIPDGGIDISGFASSGPYNLNPGDTLKFITAIVAGDNYDEIIQNANMAEKIVNMNYEISKPPIAPELTAVPGDGKIYLFWDNRSESDRDPFTNEHDFEGYRLYKSVDNGVNWDQINRNINRTAGPDPVPLMQIDKINGFGENTGLQYSYVDSNVTNGFSYWYSITAFDKGDSAVASLESPIGNTLDVLNTVEATPRTNPSNWTPVSTGSVVQTGTGTSDYLIDILPCNPDFDAQRTYSISFYPVAIIEKGDLNSTAAVDITDISQTKNHEYAAVFTSSNTLKIYDVTDGTVVIPSLDYVSGQTINFDGLELVITDEDPNTPVSQLPGINDSILIKTGLLVEEGSRTVLGLMPFEYEKSITTIDSISFKIIPSKYVEDAVRLAGDVPLEILIDVSDESEIIEENYTLEFKDPSEGDNIFINFLVKDSDENIVFEGDSIANGESVNFNGIQISINFNNTDPPGTGNFFRIFSNIPEPPGYGDIFTFTIEPPVYRHTSIVSELNKVKVVPNPYVVSTLYEPNLAQLRREPLRQMQFINLPSRCTIYIFTLDGDLVKTIDHTNMTGTEVWDMRTDGSREITTGVYLFIVKTDNNQRTGRFAVIK